MVTVTFDRHQTNREPLLKANHTPRPQSDQVTCLARYFHPLQVIALLRSTCVAMGGVYQTHAQPVIFTHYR